MTTPVLATRPCNGSELRTKDSENPRESTTLLDQIFVYCASLNWLDKQARYFTVGGSQSYKVSVSQREHIM